MDWTTLRYAEVRRNAKTAHTIYGGKMIDRIKEIFSRLNEKYPAAKCELNYGSVFELLVAVILSAQCTDKRVNEVTKVLFAHADKPEQFAAMKQEELEKLIYTCGFYHNKAKSIISAASDICEKFEGKVPSDLDGLMRLRGVGRKTANVVLNVAFNQPTIPVDTHVFRVSHRLGLSNSNTPEKVEFDLCRIIPENLKQNAHHLLIFHGRYCCKAIKPLCKECPLTDLCLEYPKLIQNK